MFNERGEIRSNVMVAPEIFEMAAHLPKIAGLCQPGQFLHVRTSPADACLLDPLLRRPFSVYKVDLAGGVLSVLYDVVGRGTKMLSQRRRGESIDVLGPVGHGFSILEGLKSAWLVAGGMGIAPLVFLAHRLSDSGVRSVALIGARTKERILGEDELAALGVEVYLATDDGSVGYAGPVTDLLGELLECSSAEGVFAVGPEPMLRKVAELTCSRKIPCQMSLESRMACGVGACLGCVVRVRSSDGMPQYKRVCVDGPVFDARELIL